MATPEAMNKIVTDSGLDKYLQQTVLSLIEKQPVVSPDMLEAITAPAPSITPEQNAERIITLKNRVNNFKREVPPDPAAVEPVYILPVEVEGDMGDILSDFKLLQRAGVGFGKPASMRLYLALKVLLHKNIGAREGEKIVRVRSWGKVLGLNDDYLVAECVMDGRQPMPAVREGLPASVVPADPVGTEFADYLTSSNHFVYYVTHAPSEEWVRLPDVQPDQIKAARNIKRAFTGDLNSPVYSKAPFPGKEAQYLRAQIARITMETRIAPKGHLQDVTEEGGPTEVGQSEEGTFHGLTTDEMCDLKNKAWVHASSDLLPQGRASYYNYGWSSDDPEAKDPKLEKNRPALQSIHLDKAPFLGAPAWSAHICGALAPEYACVVIRSNLWPGACTVAQGYNFINYYVGNGASSSGTMFAPTMAWPIGNDIDHKEYARGPKANGVCGDLNLEPPPPPPAEEAPPA